MKSRWCTAIGLLVGLAGCSLGPKAPTIVGRVHAPMDYHAVRLYLPECAPAQYKTVAKLDASKLGGFSSYQFNMLWLEQLRRQAADLGANALLLNPIGRSGTGPPANGPGFGVEAIWTPAVSGTARGMSPWAATCTVAAKKLRYKVSQFPPMRNNVSFPSGAR